jgi:hypothetical protein
MLIFDTFPPLRNVYFILEVYLEGEDARFFPSPSSAHAHAERNDVLNLVDMNFRLHFCKYLKHLSSRHALLSFNCCNTDRAVVLCISLAQTLSVSCCADALWFLDKLKCHICQLYNL